MQAAPLTSGRPMRQQRTDGLSFLETRHPLGMVLGPHEHDHACLNLVLEGCYHEQYARTGGEFPPLWVGFKPAGEAHANRFTRAPARCLLIEVRDEELLEPGAGRRGPAWSRDPRAASLGLRIWRELGAPDDASRLALEEWGLALFDCVIGVTEATPTGSARIRSAVELLHDAPALPWSLSALSRCVGLHPSHLARGFRARQGCTVGDYLRRLRLNEVARRLALGRGPVATLAAELGFSDQSHCTRAFRAEFGIPPGRYRRAFRG